MNPIVEALLSVLVIAGAVFTLIGSLGLVRFQDFYARLHAPTKATTLGVGCLLIASSLFLSHFAGDTPWAHIDIAGPSQNEEGRTWHPMGCSGFGDRTGRAGSLRAGRVA